MLGLFGKLRGRSGFSMAEVVVAMFVFAAAVTGIAGMMISGGANVTLGAMDQTAITLANKKIEDVKSLPFYKPWSGSPLDIDDSYYDMNRTNANQFVEPVTDPAPSDTSLRYEKYGSIAGFPKYKRVTTAKYLYVPGSGNTDLTDAVMNTNWKNSDPQGTQFDQPRGGANASTTTDLHAILVQVKVYYQTDFGERSYVEQAVAGDMIIAGGSNNPLMAVNSINPTTGQWQVDTNLALTVNMTTSGWNPLTDKMSVYLWYPGEQNLPSVEQYATVNSAGTTAAVHFNLSDSRCRPGMYNLGVYWQTRGVNYDKFRECFSVTVPAPTVTSVSANNWGYRRQIARTVTINGTNLWGATVLMKGPRPSNTYSIAPTSVTASQYSVVATFNITGDAASRPNDTRWDFEVSSIGGTYITDGVSHPAPIGWNAGDTDAKRFWMNPPPVFTRISPMEAVDNPGYFDWAYKTNVGRRVRIEGQYLYGFDNTLDRQATISWYNPGNGTTMTTANATWVSGAAGDACVYDTPMILSFPVKACINPSDSAPHSEVANTRWNVNMTGALGGTAVSTADNQRVLMNPQPTCSSIQNLPASAYRKTGVVTSSVIINGSYFQDSLGVYLTNNGGNWSDNTVIIPCGISSINGAGNRMSGVVVNMDKNSFIKWNGGSVVPGTSTLLNDTTYTACFQNGNWDWQGPAPTNWQTAYTMSISHAPIAITNTPAGKTNNWGQLTGQINGNYFDPTGTTITCLTNPSGVNTLSGTVTVNNAYNPGQYLSDSIYYNCIDMGPGNYTIRVTDTENNRYADGNLAVSYMTPELISYSMTSGNKGTAYSNVKVYGRGLYAGSIQVRMSGPGQERYCSDNGFCSCGTSNRGNRWYKYSSGDTIGTNRAGTSVWDNHTITLETHYGDWSHSHCIWPVKCTHSGYTQDPSTLGDDVDQIYVSGPWGWSTGIDPAINIL